MELVSRQTLQSDGGWARASNMPLLSPSSTDARFLQVLDSTPLIKGYPVICKPLPELFELARDHRSKLLCANMAV